MVNSLLTPKAAGKHCRGLIEVRNLRHLRCVQVSSAVHWCIIVSIVLLFGYTLLKWPGVVGNPAGPNGGIEVNLKLDCQQSAAYRVDGARTVRCELAHRHDFETSNKRQGTSKIIGIESRALHPNDVHLFSDSG